jgi:hypothetical protein
MTEVFAQKIYKDGIEITYDCSITDKDLVCFTHYTNNEVLDSIEIDFPSLREYMNNKKDYVSENYQIKEGMNFIRIFSQKNDDKILIPQTFLIDAYNVLNTLWEDD